MFEEKTTYKFLRLFLPLPLFTIALILCCAILQRIFVAGDGFLRTNEDIFDAYLPFGFAAIFAAALIGPRTGILKFGRNSVVRYKLRFLYALTAMLIIALPCVKSQEYLNVATSSAVRVHSAAAITSAKLARYYMAGRTCMDRNRLIARPTVWAASARSSLFRSRFNFALAVLVPVCDETTGAASQVWIAFRYEGGTSNWPSESEKQDEYNKFLRDSQQAFAAVNPDQFRFLERLGPTSRYDYFKRALDEAGAASPSSPIILEPHTERFEGKAERMFWPIIWWFITGSLVWLLMAVAPPLDEEAPRVKRDRGAQMEGI